MGHGWLGMVRSGGGIMFDTVAEELQYAEMVEFLNMWIGKRGN